jgi:hypothetical protein
MTHHTPPSTPWVGTKVGQTTAVNSSLPVLDSKLYTLRQKIITDHVKRKKLAGDASLRMSKMASDDGTCPFSLTYLVGLKH